MTIEYKDSKRIVANEADLAVISSRGTVTTSGSDTIITFTESGTFTPTSSFNVETVVVAGGGGSGGGGGGAGGIVYDAVKAVTPQSYTITVGNGGDGGDNSNNGTAGEDSVFDNITAIGGGYGAKDNTNGGSGGSGGGGGATSINVGAGGSATQTASGGDTGYGNAGGSYGNNSAPHPNGGGGGAGAVGGNGSGSTCGSGGAGIVNPISGSTIGELSGGSYYLGGGGGGGRSGLTQGSGGLGGGGNGSASTGENGTANTGGGGGGSFGNTSTGNGGSGVVIIKFTTSGNTYDTSLGGKPINVQDNSLLVEKDTARRYWFDANPLLDDDFSTDDWTDSGANVGISSGVMNFDIDRTTTDQSSYYQLSRALSDTKWTMRLHDVIVTTKSGGVEVFIGVSSNTSGAQTAQDFIGLNLGDNTANPVLGGVDSDGAVIARLAGDYTYSLSTTYNIEIIRESATSYRIKVFSNSGFDSTALFSQSYTCTATTTGLQYVKFANGQVAGSTENIIGTCSKVEIFDGVTTASGGGQWTRQLPTLPTISDLVLHLDANASSTITKDSSNLVATWGDGSSASNDITASGSARPTWVDDTQTGLPVIRFDGSNNIMTGTTPSYSLPNTLFMVCTTPNADSEAMFDGDTSRNLFNRQGTNTYRIYAGAGVTGGTANTAMQVFTVVFNNGSPALNINGSAQSLSGTNIGTSALDDIVLGAFDGGSGKADYDVCEVLFYNKALSTSEISSVESYLNKKWGVY